MKAMTPELERENLDRQVETFRSIPLTPLNMEEMMIETIGSYGPQDRARLQFHNGATNAWIRWGKPELLKMILDSIIEPLLYYGKTDNPIDVNLETHRGQREREAGHLLVTITDHESCLHPHTTDHVLTNLLQVFMVDRPVSAKMLHLARKLIEMHGGQLEAEGGPEGELIVWFTLPLAATSSGR